MPNRSLSIARGGYNDSITKDAHLLPLPTDEARRTECVERSDRADTRSNDAPEVGPIRLSLRAFSVLPPSSSSPYGVHIDSLSIDTSSGTWDRGKTLFPTIDMGMPPPPATTPPPPAPNCLGDASLLPGTTAAAGLTSHVVAVSPPVTVLPAASPAGPSMLTTSSLICTADSGSRREKLRGSIPADSCAPSWRWRPEEGRRAVPPAKGASVGTACIDGRWPSSSSTFRSLATVKAWPRSLTSRSSSSRRAWVEDINNKQERSACIILRSREID